MRISLRLPSSAPSRGALSSDNSPRGQRPRERNLRSIGEILATSHSYSGNNLRPQGPPSEMPEFSEDSALKQAYINSAIDEKLIESIGDLVFANQKSKRRKNLRVLPVGIERFRGFELSIMRQLSRSFLITQSLVDGEKSRSKKLGGLHESNGGSISLSTLSNEPFGSSKHIFQLLKSTWPKIRWEEALLSNWESLPLQR